MKLLKTAITAGLMFLLLSFLNYYVYKWATQNRVYSNINQCSNYHHVLILGSGTQNPVFYSRMDSAINLYHHQLINRITCSGLTGVIHYNEPYDMKNYLLKNNIPPGVIEVDSAGTDTFASVCNYAKKYGGDSVVIISQAQHLYRALFIADRKGLQAIGFTASAFNGSYNRDWRMKEFFSRIKTTIDLVFGN